MDMHHMANGMSESGTNSTGGSLGEIDFQRLAQTIATSIQKIVQNVSAMQRMVNQINTLQDSPECKKQLHQIMTYTHQVVSDTNAQLKEVDKCKERHLKIQRDRLVDEFTTALTAFQALQRKTVDIEKHAIRQARANSYNISKPPGHQQNSGETGGNYFDDNFVKNKAGQMQIQEEIDMRQLEEQERAIRELEENIVGVNEIYKKLGAMVYDQGAAVDSIEQQVEQTSVFVSQGTENLRKASSYKNKVRRKKLILLSILSAVLILFIIVLSIHYGN